MYPLAAVAALATAALAIEPTREPVSPDGTRAVVDLPTSQHMRNVGGSDGAGLCVFTSLQHASYWQNVRELDGFRAWMQRRPGGGWPQKVDQMFAQFCREKGVSVPPYIQHTGGDESFLELALKTDRVPCVTYAGRDDFYSGRIAHMVNLAHLDSQRAAIIDNNRPGNWVWMTRAEFLSRWRDMQGGWAIVLLADPPPPMPEVHARSRCICGDDCSCKSGECPAKCPVRAPKFEQLPNCPNGRCPNAEPHPLGVLIDHPSLKADGPGAWVPSIGGGEWGFWREGKCLARCFADGRCEAVDAQGFATGKAIYPPAPLPNGVKVKPIGVFENHGVQMDKIHEHPAYSINGKPCSKDEAHAVLAGADGLKDDSDRWHLTAVGDAAFVARFKADVAAMPSDIRGKLLVQGYGPNEWPVALYRLPAGVSLRKPSPVRSAPEIGTIATADYSAAKLADLMTVPGGPNPKPVAPSPKQPEKPDPLEPIKPEPKPAPAPAPNEPQPVNPKPDYTGWIIAALVGLYLLLRRK